MLRQLGREGRSHNLGPMVAGMIEYAAQQAPAPGRRRRGKNAAPHAELLAELAEPMPGDEPERVEGAVQAWLHWYDMPWEH